MEKASSQARVGGKGTDAVVLRKDLWFQSVEQLIILKARDFSPMFRIHSSALQTCGFPGMTGHCHVARFEVRLKLALSEDAQHRINVASVTDKKMRAKLLLYP